jgi:integrase
MPAERREQIRRPPSGKWQLRYYDRKGVRHSGGAFSSKSAARAHYRDVIEPELSGRRNARRDLTFTELVDTFLERHGKITTARTIRTLRERLQRPLATFGAVPLADLEGMVHEIARFVAGLPDRYRHPVVLAFRQAVEAGVRYGYLASNPVKAAGPNPSPRPRPVRVFARAELDAIAEELDTRGAAAVRFAAATGLRPAEWSQLERRDVDRQGRIVTVRGTKTLRSRREVPLTADALAALETLPPRLDKQAGRPLRLRELPQARLGIRDRRGRDLEAGPALRPPVDVRLQRPRRRSHGVRARARDGHERPDDRAPLRSAARHRTRVTALEA